MTDDRFEQRLTDLEIKASFAEDLVDHLNALVARQQDQIDRLARELAALRQQAPADEPGRLAQPTRRVATALLIRHPTTDTGAFA